MPGACGQSHPGIRSQEKGFRESAQMKTMAKVKNASPGDMVIHAFNKYLLSTYYVSSAVLSALQ